MNKLISTKDRLFIFLVGPEESGKSQFSYQWLKYGTFQPNFDKKFFYQNYQPLWDQMQKAFKNHELFQGATFDFFCSPENNGTK